MVLHRADEGKGARNIVVRNDEGHAAELVDVVIDPSERFLDVGMRPLLKGASEIDADQFSENTGIRAFKIVFG